MKQQLQLLQSPGGKPGELGFKLTGTSADGSQIFRVWLRQAKAWDRAINPLVDSSSWDVRCYRLVDSAFALETEQNLEVPNVGRPGTSTVHSAIELKLAALAEEYRFAPAPELQKLSANGDKVHDTVLAWAKKVTSP